MEKKLLRAMVLGAILALILATGCITHGNEKGEVVIYVASDQDFSEPVLQKFEKETGIRVKSVYDTETTKTVGLVNRLIAEKSNPQADVFWNNEVTRTIMLKKSGVLATYYSPNAGDKPANMKDAQGYWTGFSARARVIIYNTDLVSDENAPKSILDLTKPEWKNKACLANPLFGSTGSHVAALFALWGKEAAEEYFMDLKNNGVMIVESNGMVKNMVVSGECYAGLTDTDDANAAVINDYPVKVVYPDRDGFGTLVIPNSVMLIAGGPNPENGKKLVDYLLGKDAESQLAASKAVQMPLGKDVTKPSNVPQVSEIMVMNLTLQQIYNELELSQRFVQNTLIT